MASKDEHAFLTYTSFPSSIKLANDGVYLNSTIIQDNLPVTSASAVRAEIMVKSDNVPTPMGAEGPELGSYLTIHGSDDGLTYRFLDFRVPIETVYGVTDWTKYLREKIIPSDVNFLRIYFTFAKGYTWFDDLRLYQNDMLIYENKFSSWGLPLIGLAAVTKLLGIW